MPIKTYYSASHHKIPDCVSPRLSMYYRALNVMDQDEIISSNQLAAYSGVSPAQVRKDLTYFGHSGIPGKGYRIAALKEHLVQILGLNRNWNVALIGTGYLGSALLSWDVLRNHGLQIVCAFDSDPAKVNQVFAGVKIQDIRELEETVRRLEVQMAMILVPPESAKRIIDLLVQSGIHAILNFAPVRHEVPGHVHLINIDFLFEFERLTFFLNKQEREGPHGMTD